jgi:Leucine-rich repeat (LRR) protein
MSALESLEFLDLRANRLTSLPALVEDLPRLRKLDLRWNKLDARRAWQEEMTRRGCAVYV